MIGKDSHVELQCHKCHASYFLPRALYVAAKASEKIHFFCPYGHEAHFPEGDTEEDKLRRERDRLKQENARLVEEATTAWNTANKLKAEVTTQIKVRRMNMQRVAQGICPCCNRMFANMHRHMQTKHPEFKAEFVQ